MSKSNRLLFGMGDNDFEQMILQNSLTFDLLDSIDDYQFYTLANDLKLKKGDSNIITFDGSSNVIVENNLTVSGTMSLTGNVGIGTDTPNTLLHIEGPDNATPPLVFISNTSEDWGGIRLGDSSAPTTQNFDLLYSSANQDFKIRSDDIDNIMYFEYDSGNVGLGNDDPDSPLHITSTSGRIMKLNRTGSTGEGVYTELNNPNGTRLLMGIGGTGFTGTDDTSCIIGNWSYGDLELRTDGTRRMTIKADGEIGIGNSSPAHPLDVSGIINTSTGYNIASTEVLSATTLGSSVLASSLTSVGTLTSATITGDLIVDTDTLFVDASADSVGINTATPSFALHIENAGNQLLKIKNTNDFAPQVYLDTAKTSTGAISVINFQREATTVSQIEVDSTDVVNEYGEIQFKTKGVGGLTQKMVIDEDGNVGIGTDAPTKKLTIQTDTLYDGLYLESSTGTFVELGKASANNSGYFRLKNNGDNTTGLKLDGQSDSYFNGGNVGIGIVSPATPLDVVGDINTSTDYNIASTSVLNATTLGSGVVNSSLTSVGTLTGLNVDGGGADLDVEFNASTGFNSTLYLTEGTSQGTKFGGYFKYDGATNNIHLGGVATDVEVNAMTITRGNGDITAEADLTVVGDLSATLITAAQPNITSLGTIASLDTTIMNTATGYDIASTEVLSATTLGSGVVNSSLTSVGTLTSATITGDLIVNTDTLFVDTSANLVGINQSNPAYALDIEKNNGTLLKIKNTSTSAATNMVIDTGRTSNGNTGVINFQREGTTINNITSYGTDNTNSYGELQFKTKGSGGLTQKMVIDEDGNVGIGIGAPAYPLDVVGNINTSTAYNINGTSVLGATTLGSGVVNSSLTSVGTLTGLNVATTTEIELENTTTDMNVNIIAANSNTATLYLTEDSTTKFGTFIDYNGDPNTGRIGTIDADVKTVAISIARGTANVDFLGDATISGDLIVNTNTLFVDASAGNVGIGTAAPTGSVHLYETTGTVAGANGVGSLVLEHGDSGGKSSITFVSTVNKTSDYGYIKFDDNGGGSSEKAKLTIGIENDTISSVADVVAINCNGNETIFGANGEVDLVGTLTGVAATFTGNLTVGGDVNTTGVYKVNGNNVIGSTTLGSVIVNSSLTNVGTLTGLTMGGIVLTNDNPPNDDLITDFQNLNTDATTDFIQTPWINTRAIESWSEKGSAGTAMVFGLSKYDNTGDNIALITQGNTNLLVDSSNNVSITNDLAVGGRITAVMNRYIVIRNSTQNTTTSTLETVLFNSVKMNVGGFTYSAGAITIPTNGFYFFTWSVLFESNSSGYRKILISHNDNVNENIGIAIHENVGGNSNQMQVSGYFECVAGDEIKGKVYQNSGNTIYVSGSTTDNYCKLTIMEMI
jgi:hypothetical protein